MPVTQEQIILAGRYNLNFWFNGVELEGLSEVPIGRVGSVRYLVNQEQHILIAQPRAQATLRQAEGESTVIAPKAGGEAKAEVARNRVEAMGEYCGPLQLFQPLAGKGLRLTPCVLVAERSPRHRMPCRRCLRPGWLAPHRLPAWEAGASECGQQQSGRPFA
jgi:hypothetical protein